MIRYCTVFLCLIFYYTSAYAQERTNTLSENASRLCLSDTLTIQLRFPYAKFTGAIRQDGNMMGFQKVGDMHSQQTTNTMRNKNGGFDTLVVTTVEYQLKPIAYGKYTIPRYAATLPSEMTVFTNALTVEVIADCAARTTNPSFEPIGALPSFFTQPYLAEKRDMGRYSKLYKELTDMATWLEISGEVLKEPRNVYVTFNFKTAEDRAAAVALITQQGYRTPAPGDVIDKKPGEFFLWAAKKVVVAPDTLFQMFRGLIEAVETNFPRVQYEGLNVQQFKGKH